jgi:hypothetical protein
MKEKKKENKKRRKKECQNTTSGQVDAASVSAQESGPCVTGKHNAWESSNNAQRLFA